MISAEGAHYLEEFCKYCYDCQSKREGEPCGSHLILILEQTNILVTLMGKGLQIRVTQMQKSSIYFDALKKKWGGRILNYHVEF